MGEPDPQHDARLDEARLAAMSAALVSAGVGLATLGPRVGDEAWVTQALGQPPRGLWQVAARDEAHRPIVLATYPLWCEGRDGLEARCRPFPNTLWLCGPHWLAAISDMERLGAIARWQRELQGDAALRAHVTRDHARYAAMRWAMLTPADRALVASRGWTRALRDRGVGGLMAGGDHLKCLHAHVAHHLACGNALGGRVLAQAMTIAKTPSADAPS